MTSSIRPPGDEPSSELRAYLGVLWKRKWYAILVLYVVIAAGVFYMVQKTPIYESTAQVLVRAVSLSSQPGTSAQTVDMNTELEVATSQVVAARADQIVRRAGLTPGTVTVEVPSNTATFLFHAQSTDPRAAQVTANAYAGAYLAFRKEGLLQDLQSAAKPIQDRITQLNAQLAQTQSDLLASISPTQRALLQLRYNDLLSQRSVLENQSHQLILPTDIREGEVILVAPLPTRPVSPDRKKILALAILAGLFLGVGVAFLADRLDTRIRSRGDLQASGAVPVLGVIPRVRGAGIDAGGGTGSARANSAPGSGPDLRASLSGSFETLTERGRRLMPGADRRARRGPPVLISVSDPASPAAEAYRNLRTSLLVVLSEHGMKSVMITSARAEEGKSSTTANLGVAFAQSGRRTILVSADLRRPTLHTYFEVTQGMGLTDVLAGKVGAVEALAETGVPNLRLLDCGTQPNDAAAIGSEMTRRMLSLLENDADVVLVDSTPVVGIPDAVALAPLVDGVVLVADATRATLDLVREARADLDQAGAKMLGSVLTSSTLRRSSDGYYPYRTPAPQKVVAVERAGGNGSRSASERDA